MAKIRKHMTDQFSIKSNKISQDGRLTYKARGLFDYMWSMPSDWEFTIDALVKVAEKDGKTSVREGLKELETFGYLYREQIRIHSGKFASVMIYDLYDDPENNQHYMDSTEVRKSDNGTEVRLTDVRKSNVNISKHTSKEKKRDILTINEDVKDIFDSYILVLDEDKQRLIKKSEDEIIRRIIFNLDKSVKNIKRYVTTSIDNELKKLYGLHEQNNHKKAQEQKLEKINSTTFTEEEKTIAAYDWVATLGEENEGENEYGN